MSSEFNLLKQLGNFLIDKSYIVESLINIWSYWEAVDSRIVNKLFKVDKRFGVQNGICLNKNKLGELVEQLDEFKWLIEKELTNLYDRLWLCENSLLMEIEISV